MIVVTSMLTGLFAAMLRSAFAVIIVAFMIAALFAGAFLFYGASFLAFALTVLGFNAGLVLFGVVHVLGGRTRSAS